MRNQDPLAQSEEKPELATCDKGFYHESGMRIAESKYDGKDSEDIQEENPLEEIEKQIKECAKKLQEIKLELLKESDIYSDNYLKLEDERNQIKKRVIDLDFQHKILCADIIKERRIKEEEEKQKRRIEAEEEEEKRKRELEERMEKMRVERDERFNEEKKTEKVAGDSLERSRRRLRIAEIEAELAESRLRRSRVAILNAELDSLRTPNFCPYPRYSYLSDYYPYPYTRSYIYPNYYLW